MRRTAAQRWSLLATILTGVGCVALLGGVTFHQPWLFRSAVLIIPAATLANAAAIVRARRPHRRDGL